MAHHWRHIIEPADHPWQNRAACLGQPADVMFPSDSHGVAEAKKLCDRCPVTQPCLDYALANRIDDGVWGGTSERERRRIHKQRKGTAA